MQRGVLPLALAALAALLALAAAGRSLTQSFSRAVSVSGGEGPFGNCGYTQTEGNAAAYASGPPCAQVVPAPPPSTSCPATTVTVEWQKPSSGAAFTPLTLCPGSTVAFKWNTGTPSRTYGLYELPSATCPASATATGVQLIITPASSPNPAGVVSATLNAPGTFHFADLTNCASGQLQTVNISPTPAASAVAASG